MKKWKYETQIEYLTKVCDKWFHGREQLLRGDKSQYFYLFFDCKFSIDFLTEAMEKLKGDKLLVMLLMIVISEKGRLFYLDSQIDDFVNFVDDEALEYCTNINKQEYTDIRLYLAICIRILVGKENFEFGECSEDYSDCDDFISYNKCYSLYKIFEDYKKLDSFSRIHTKMKLGEYQWSCAAERTYTVSNYCIPKPTNRPTKSEALAQKFVGPDYCTLSPLGSIPHPIDSASNWYERTFHAPPKKGHINTKFPTPEGGFFEKIKSIGVPVQMDNPENPYVFYIDTKKMTKEQRKELVKLVKKVHESRLPLVPDTHDELVKVCADHILQEMSNTMTFPDEEKDEIEEIEEVEDIWNFDEEEKHIAPIMNFNAIANEVSYLLSMANLNATIDTERQRISCLNSNFTRKFLTILFAEKEYNPCKIATQIMEDVGFKPNEIPDFEVIKAQKIEGDRINILLDTLEKHGIDYQFEDGDEDITLCRDSIDINTYLSYYNFTDNEHEIMAKVFDDIGKEYKASLMKDKFFDKVHKANENHEKNKKPNQNGSTYPKNLFEKLTENISPEKMEEINIQSEKSAEKIMKEINKENWVKTKSGKTIEEALKNNQFMVTDVQTAMLAAKQVSMDVSFREHGVYGIVKAHMIYDGNTWFRDVKISAKSVVSLVNHFIKCGHISFDGSRFYPSVIEVKNTDA